MEQFSIIFKRFTKNEEKLKSHFQQFHFNTLISYAQSTLLLMFLIALIHVLLIMFLTTTMDILYERLFTARDKTEKNGTRLNQNKLNNESCILNGFASSANCSHCLITIFIMTLKVH